MAKQKPDNLKEALVDEAFSVIEEKGVEQLSFREISRRLGVSHQAPYKHFASRDHILAAVIGRCFDAFASHLNNRPKADSSVDDLRNMGLAYMGFAEQHPLMYRLMFNTALPPVHDHPEMLAKSQHAFALLRDRLATMELRDPATDVPDPARHDAVFIWAALHGLASLMQSDAIATLGLSDRERDIARQRMFQRLSLAMHDQDVDRVE
ncbi:TetR/AcrR family transcriptional regulator [Cognatiyoonia sp. IB215446]|uniref:TetR/AcrR family transcriptional regulator n=1 Tax=Cognatiyoonia sp. IB215446 TaxID=3097355 RepID=UPI002A151334|nr:TetR/AcrR family transcriptional regulator [Cognatiyoonia sp. IB215446]MDX8349578.1 TetR/AcrR family transcriptional regulator [Cognatiyoonia sp. IB215446]